MSTSNKQPNQRPWQRFSQLVGWLAGKKDTARAGAQLRSVDAGDLARGDALFALAVRENSNLELDWLWLATIVGRESQRQFCLLRALEINPESEMAARELATLGTQPLRVYAPEMVDAKART